jgi:hypothetical protein
MLTKSSVKLRRPGEQSIYKTTYPSNYYKIEHSKTPDDRDNTKIYYCNANGEEKMLEFIQ